MMTRIRGGLRVRLRSPVVSVKAHGHTGTVIHSELRGDECMDKASDTSVDVVPASIRITCPVGKVMSGGSGTAVGSFI